MNYTWKFAYFIVQAQGWLHPTKSKTFWSFMPVGIVTDTGPLSTILFPKGQSDGVPSSKRSI